MLTKAASYEELTARFRWQIPEHYNIGVDACDKWADSDRLALIHLHDDGKETRYSFKDLKRLSNRCANVLETQGVEEGDRVAILLPQRFETVIAHLAVYKLGAVAVPMAMQFGPEAIAYRLGFSGASAIVLDAGGKAKLDAAGEAFPALGTVVAVGGAPGALDFAELEAQAAPGFRPLETGPDDPAMMIFTSGTTGQPKGALHAHRVLLGHLPGFETYNEFVPRPGDVIWTPPGVKHWHGATDNTSMSHFVISMLKDGKNVDWMEQVSDEQYLK